MDRDSPDLLVGTSRCEGHESSNGGELTDDSGFRWPHEAIMLLLAEYQKREHVLRTRKVSHKKFWAAISHFMGEHGYQISGPQCQSKFGGLKKTYRNIMDHNSRSGNWSKTWPYLNVMNDLIGDQPLKSSLATCSSDIVTCELTGSESDTEFTAESTDHSSSEAASKRMCNSAVEKLIRAMDERRKRANEEEQMRHREREEKKRIRHEENMLRKDRALELLADLLKKP